MLRPTHSLLAALVATTILVTTTLCWFGWRLIEQQAAIDDQRARDQLETSADAIAAGIGGKLAEAGERLSVWLAHPTSTLPAIDNAVVLTVSRGEATVAPRGGLPFVPLVRPSELEDRFVSAETLEFRDDAWSAAADRYRALAKVTDRRVRAGALVRLGRVLRKSGDFAQALAAYRELSALGTARTGELPAEFAALLGERAVLRTTGDAEGVATVTAKLLDGINQGRWLLTRGVASLYRDEMPPAAVAPSWQLADAMHTVWHDASARLTPSGQRIVSSGDRAVLLVWRGNGEHRALLAAFADRFFAAPGHRVAWQLTDPEGQPISGASTAASTAIQRIIGSSQYPWTLRVWSDAPLPARGTESRRTLLAMMAAVLVFLWGATYFMGRAIRREASVARLQSDFVAAVSHEFRTPLTSVRQIAEMLDGGRIPSQDRRQSYYRALVGEAARLQRLVETLLDFGRIEAGGQRYQFADVDASALVRRVVDDFDARAPHCGKVIAVRVPDHGMHIVADEHAIGLALRNLLDNAVKYSPGQPTIWVDLHKENGHAAIRVVDHGVGIPLREQKAIFGKFVRGHAAAEAKVNGTGVGLSMVQHIARAHRGDIRVDSEPGHGSTFTLLIPAR